MANFNNLDGTMRDTFTIGKNNKVSIHNDSGTIKIQNDGGANAIIPLPFANAIELQELGTSTYDDLQDHVNNITSSCIVDGGMLSDNGNGTVTVSAGKGYIKISNSDIAATVAFDIDANTNVTLVDNSLNYVYVNYNGGSPPIYASTTTISTLNTHDIFQIGLVYREGTTAHVLDAGQHLQDGLSHTNNMLSSVFGPTRATGLVTTESGTRNIAVTAGTAWDGLVEVILSSFASSGTDFTYWYNNGSWQSSAIGVIDNLQYNNFGTGLATLSNNRYGVHWVFEHFEGDIHIVYGIGDYTISQAENTSLPASLPGLVESFAIPIAKIIVLKSATNLLTIENSYTTPFTTSIVNNHNDLGIIQGGATDDNFHLTNAEHGNISAIGGTTSAADKLPYFDGAESAALADFTVAGRNLLDDANASAQRTTLSLVPGTHVQTQDDELEAIAGLTSAGNKMVRFTGSGTADLVDFLDQDDMSSNSATAVASQQSIKAYVDAGGGASRWTTLAATTDFLTAANSISTIGMVTDQTSNIQEGTALKFTLTGGSAGTYYAVCTAITSSGITIAGAPLTIGAGELTDLSYGTPEMTQHITFFVNGTYADTVDSDLLKNDMNTRRKWELSNAYVVQYSCLHMIIDSGTQPKLNMAIGGSHIDSNDGNKGIQLSSTADTWISSVVTMRAAFYGIFRGDEIEIAVNLAGGTGNAAHLTVSCTIVME